MLDTPNKKISSVNSIKSYNFIQFNKQLDILLHYHNGLKFDTKEGNICSQNQTTTLSLIRQIENNHPYAINIDPNSDIIDVSRHSTFSFPSYPLKILAVLAINLVEY